MKQLIMLLTILSLSVIGCKGKDKIEYYCQKEELEEIKIQIPDTMIDINKLPEQYERKVLIEMKFGEGEGEMGLARISSIYNGGPFDIMENGDIVIIDGNNNRVHLYDKYGKRIKTYLIDRNEELRNDTMNIIGENIELFSYADNHKVNKVVIKTNGDSIEIKKDIEWRKKSQVSSVTTSEKELTESNSKNDNKKLFSKISNYSKEYNLTAIINDLKDVKRNLYVQYVLNDKTDSTKEQKQLIMKINAEGKLLSAFEFDEVYWLTRIDKEENVYIYKTEIVWTGDPYDNPSDLYKSLDREKSRVYIIKYELKK